MQVTKDGIERIKAANPIADVVAERGITLKRKGRNLFALCPFHEEKQASFSANPAKGLFHCFGCGVSGDVIGFVTRHDKTTFAGALEALARRARLDLKQLMQERPRVLRRTPLQALTPPPELVRTPPRSSAKQANGNGGAAVAVSSAEILARVVEHYHRTLLTHTDAQEYLKKRGLTDVDLWRTFKLGYADGSLLKVIPKGGEPREALVSQGVITQEGRELLGGCLVFPIPDPVSGVWTTLYGRGLRADRHCYLPGPLRGVLNYQSARSASEVVLTESVIDALSFHQVGITTAIPLYGTNGFTSDHLDALLKSQGKRVVLCLDNDDAGRKAGDQLKQKLSQAGLAVRLATLPEGIKDPNELLVSRNGDASEVLRQVLTAAVSSESAAPAPSASESASGAAPQAGVREEANEGLAVRFGERLYHAKAFNLQATDRLRVVLRIEAADGRFLVDAVDLYAARSRKEYAKRAASKLSADAAAIEEELLSLLTHLEAFKGESLKQDGDMPQVAPLSDAERAEALAFLRRADLLEQVAQDIDALGYVGEGTNKRLLYWCPSRASSMTRSRP